MDEAYMGSAVTIDKYAPVFTTSNTSRQKWVEEQSNDPNIGEVK